MDDGIGPVSLVLGERQKDGPAASRIAALADELQQLRIDELRRALVWVGSSKMLHVGPRDERVPR
jgi:LmbE family N-acetylglucosaminyl deacetylase